MPRNPKSTEKPSAKRTSTPGRKVDGKTVESSVRTNTRPRQPQIRQTPARRVPPKPVPKKLHPRDKRADPNSIGSKSREAVELRAARDHAAKEILEKAQATGMLPHEWMLAVMRGEQISHYAYDSDTQEIIEVIVLPTFADRMEAARSAAPFFANRLSTPKGGSGGPVDPAKQPGVMEVPLSSSMAAWADLAGPSQASLKKEVTK